MRQHGKHLCFFLDVLPSLSPHFPVIPFTLQFTFQKHFHVCSPALKSIGSQGAIKLTQSTLETMIKRKQTFVLLHSAFWKSHLVLDMEHNS